ncbi:hypothetical protein AHIS2_p024 [Acaryochloris phage A-HIS2]|nr:hypothetical protein AHIS2_p024 [Acaryochloris phage A-HIS2]
MHPTVAFGHSYAYDTALMLIWFNLVILGFCFTLSRVIK